MSDVDIPTDFYIRCDNMDQYAAVQGVLFAHGIEWRLAGDEIEHEDSLNLSRQLKGVHVAPSLKSEEYYIYRYRGVTESNDQIVDAGRFLSLGFEAFIEELRERVENDELKPCPFCGKRPEMEKNPSGVTIGCHNICCSARPYIRKAGGSNEILGEAKKEWNEPLSEM